MKKTFLILIAFFIQALVSCASSKNENVAETKIASEPAGEQASVIIDSSNGNRHFLWRVSDENSYVWLLGSIHFADSSFYPMDSVIERAFVWAEELGVEIDVSDDSVTAEIGKKSVEQGLLPKGETLNQVLPRSLWNSLDSLCSAWNYPVATLMHYRPWFAAMMLSSVGIMRTGINPEYGIDNVFMGRAVEEGKVIVGLETVEEQVDALSGSENSDSAGIYYMKNTLREISSLDSMISGIIASWKTGNDSLMQVLLDVETGECRPEDDCESDAKLKSEIETRLYDNRNAKMAENIEEFLAEDRKVFVVVGVAHLALERNNVVDLLLKKGYKIERF